MKKCLIAFLGAALLGAGGSLPQARAGITPLTTVRVASGLNLPIFVTSPRDDYTRLFIVEQRGVIRILNLATGQLNATFFLNIDSEVVNISGSDERGLLGLAFDPNFATNGFFYVSFIDNSSFTVIRRYTVSAGNPDVANAASGTNLLRFAQPFANHNGGMIAFGPDGYLYMGFGDGGSADDPGNRAQNTGLLFGKMLRVGVGGGDDYPADATKNFEIPVDNPFVGAGNPLDEIWALGLRNPWRWSFDRATGDLWIGDVGQGIWEEVDFQPAASVGGENYGWRCMEGNSCTGLSGCTCNAAALTQPILVYNHSAGRCSITGGYVYRGAAMPDMHGLYFYGDWCSGNVWTITQANVTPVQRLPGELSPTGGGVLTNVASFGEDAFGEIYIVDRGGTTTGEIYKIVPANFQSLDCNGNFVQDDLEVSFGLADDCNGNLVPDGCDIVTGGESDCNGNGVLDSCDLIAGTAPDCNTNTIPDECDIAAGAPDANQNGIPDECDIPLFIRLDCNLDNALDVSDPIAILNFLFDPQSPGVGCEDACDVNDDGMLDIADGVSGLGYLFGGAAAPPPPFPSCGADPTSDAVSCATLGICP
ncbi:MAG: sorbosone dehydrogenase family protein [Planctomycetota bacterium]